MMIVSGQLVHGCCGRVEVEDGLKTLEQFESS